jgi:hypothetical protein
MNQFWLDHLRGFAFSRCFAPIILAIAVSNCGQLPEQEENSVSQSSENRYDILWFIHENDARASWGTYGGDGGDLRKFQEYVQRRPPASKPPAFTSKLVLNCWEFVLYGAWRGGRIHAEDIQKVYAGRSQNTPLRHLITQSTSAITYTISPQGKVKLVPAAPVLPGDLIFMDESSHVIQATGNTTPDGKLEVISYSPRPIWGDGGYEGIYQGLAPEITSLESLIEELIDLYPDVPSDWQNISLLVGKANWAS